MVIAIQFQPLRPGPLIIHDLGHKMQVGLITTTRELFLSNRPSFPLNSHPRPDNGFARTGKVAVIRDVAAVTYVKPTANPSLRLIYPR